MPGKKEEFLKRLMATFRTEARDHIQAIASGLVELERDSPEEAKAGNLDAIFRAAHSLKGAARAVDSTNVELVCQSLEDVFASVNRRELDLSPGLFDVLHRAVTVLGQLLQSLEAGASDPADPRAEEIIASLKTALTAHASIPEMKPAISKSTVEAQRDNPMETPALSDTIRVSAAKLDALLLQAEELLSAKLAAGQ